jgi:hypothetical protein
MQGLRQHFHFDRSPSTARATLKRPFIHQSIEARKRSTRLPTDQVDPPRDPFQKNTAWRGRNKSGGSPPPPNNKYKSYEDPIDFNAFKRAKEPFEAELLILFGLPTLIILIPWAVKDPAALAIIPLAFLIPGVRDVLLAVLRSTFLGVRRAKRFMKEDGSSSEYYDGSNNDRYNRRSTSTATGTWSARSPPQPPPPGTYYDLSQDDFSVVQPPDHVNNVAEEEPLESRYVGVDPEKEGAVQMEDEVEGGIDEAAEDGSCCSSSSSSSSSKAEPEPPRPSSPRRWVSYNTSASFAEDEERKAKTNNDNNRLKRENKIKNNNFRSADDVRRLKSIPASPLAQVRWREREEKVDDDSDEDDNVKNTVLDELDEEVETIRWRQEREIRRLARAAQRQQRLNNIGINVNTGLTTSSKADRSPQQHTKRQQSGKKAVQRPKNNSFWGDDDDNDGDDYYSFSEKDQGSSSRKGQRRRAGVPWYARPVVSLFPFMKDWGGFM